MARWLEMSTPLHANSCSATILNCEKHLHRNYRHICVGTLDVDTSSQRATAGACYIIYVYSSSGAGVVKIVNRACLSSVAIVPIDFTGNIGAFQSYAFCV